jgi:RNA polymerase sporulation-specific sigma factor
VFLLSVALIANEEKNEALFNDEEFLLKYKTTKDPYYLNLLLTRIKNLLHYLTAGFYINGYEKEDLLQIAYIGAIQAIEKWDKNKGTLKDFIYLCARREVMSELTKWKRQLRISDNMAVSIDNILANKEKTESREVEKN